MGVPGGFSAGSRPRRSRPGSGCAPVRPSIGTPGSSGSTCTRTRIRTRTPTATATVDDGPVPIGPGRVRGGVTGAGAIPRPIQSRSPTRARVRVGSRIRPRARSTGGRPRRSRNVFTGCDSDRRIDAGDDRFDSARVHPLRERRRRRRHRRGRLAPHYSSPRRPDRSPRRIRLARRGPAEGRRPRRATDFPNRDVEYRRYSGRDWGHTTPTAATTALEPRPTPTPSPTHHTA